MRRSDPRPSQLRPPVAHLANGLNGHPARPPATPSPAVAMKAHRLIEERRVVLSSRQWDTALVCGDSAAYLVRAWRRGVSCTCPAGRNLNMVACCHKVAALALWADREATLPPMVEEASEAVAG